MDPAEPGHQPFGKVLVPTMAYDAATGQVVLFGGSNGSNLGDTWTYNGTTWTQQSPASSPSARYDSTLAYDATTGQVVLFGGVQQRWQLSKRYVDVPDGSFRDTHVCRRHGCRADARVLPDWHGWHAACAEQCECADARHERAGLSRLGTGSTCAGAVTAGQTCTVNVAFTPRYPGQRMGAVNLLDSSGTLLATAYISGTGTGPLATLSPGLLSTVAGTGTQLFCFHGDLWRRSLGDRNRLQLVLSPMARRWMGRAISISPTQSDNRIRKVTAATGILSTVAGTGTQCSSATASCGDGAPATATGSNLYFPESVAVDGAGNLYIADQKATIASARSQPRPASSAPWPARELQCSSSTATCGDGASATATGSNLDAIPLAWRWMGQAISTLPTIMTIASARSQPRPASSAPWPAQVRLVLLPQRPVATEPRRPQQAPTCTIPTGVAVDGAGNLYIADSE